MLTFLKSGFLAICIALTLASCSDHRLGGPQSPVRLRLKSFTEGANTTTYTYDSQNRVATIARPDGSMGVFSYDDPKQQTIYFYEYPDPADRSKGRTTLYPFDLQPNIYTPGAYILIGKQTGTVDPAVITIINSRNAFDKLYNYSFDTNKRLTVYYTSSGSDDATSRFGSGYTYTGENITGSTGFSGRTTSPVSVIGFDDKLNPFFGLMDPDVDPALRYSRNNPVKSELSGYPDFLRSYTYEYNAQGLPTKRTQTAGGTVVTTFAYEAY